jgi:hypothetical protein
MPLMEGKSQRAFEHNLKAELKAGKPKRQALAIAYAKKRGDGYNPEDYLNQEISMDDDDGDLILKHLSDDDRERMDACSHMMDSLRARMDAYDKDCAMDRVDKGHWIAKTNIPAGGKIERKIKQSSAGR